MTGSCAFMSLFVFIWLTGVQCFFKKNYTSHLGMPPSYTQILYQKTVLKFLIFENAKEPDVLHLKWICRIGDACLYVRAYSF